MRKNIDKAALTAACFAATLAGTPVWAQQAPAESGNTPSDTAAPAAADTTTDELLSDILASPEPSAESSVEPSAEPSAETPPDNASPPPAAPAAESAAEPAAALPTIPVATRPEEGKGTPLKDAPRSRMIEEIVVTATKREQSIRDIPQSINAITGESLENKGDLNLNDFIQETPGVTSTQGNSGYTRVNMRGITTDTGPTSPTPSPVGFFIGDTAFTDPYIANIVPDLSAFDLSGVQVLKGPQGTLFGGAALAGAVRYELQEPVLGEWQFRAFSQLVSPTDGTSAVTSGAAVNLPLNDDSLALRLAYVRRNYPGVIDDTRTGAKDVDHGSGNQYRAILLWQPDNWKIKLTHLSQDFSAPNAVYTSDTADGPREISTNIFEVPAENDFGMDSLEIGYSFDSMKLVSLSSYLTKNSTFTLDATTALVGLPPPGYPQALGLLTPVIENSKAWSQELRLQSTGSGPFQWLVGGYLYSYDMYFNVMIDTPLNRQLTGPDSLLGRLAGLIEFLRIPVSLINETTTFFEGTSDVTSSEQAGFFDLSYTMWDRLDLSAGARFYQTQVKGGFIGTGLLLRLENNGMNSDTRNKIKERGINPKFTATWHFSDDVSLYGQIAKGFRFGGVQYVPSTPTNGVPATFKSDTLWNYEMGLRTSWLDRSLQADLTAFYIRYKDPIITQSTPGIPINYNDNVSGAISQGLEANLLWYTPLEGLSLSLRGALTDAHITEPFEATGGVMVEPGTEMPGTAPEQYGGSIQYVRPFGIVDVGASAGYNYIGQGYSDLTHNAEINGYGSFDAGLIFSSSAFSFHPKLALNVSNITDEHAANAGGTASPLVPIGSVSVYAPITPRTVSLRVSVDF